jgi:hypothetical protein
MDEHEPTIVGYIGTSEGLPEAATEPTPVVGYMDEAPSAIEKQLRAYELAVSKLEKAVTQRRYWLAIWRLFQSSYAKARLAAAKDAAMQRRHRDSARIAEAVGVSLVQDRLQVVGREQADLDRILRLLRK